MASALGRAWAHAASQGGEGLLRSPVIRSPDMAGIVERLGGKTTTRNWGDTTTHIHQFENVKDPNKPHHIVEEQSHDPGFTGLSKLYGNQGHDPEEFLDAAEEQALVARARALGKQGFSAFNFTEAPRNSGLGGKLYRGMFDSLPSMSHLRVMGDLTASNKLAQGERFFDQAIRNAVAGDHPMFASMEYSNLIPQRAVARLHHPEIIGQPNEFASVIPLDDRYLMPNAYAIPMETLAGNRTGFVSAYDALRDTNPEKLLGHLAMQRASNTIKQFPNILDVLEENPADKIGALRQMADRVRPTSPTRVPSADAMIKDAATIDAMRAASRGEDPTEIVQQYMPQLLKTFRHGGLAQASIEP